MRHKITISLATGLLLAGCSVAPEHQTSSQPHRFDDYAFRSGGPTAAAPLRAGEVDDNARFDEYVRYFRACPEPDARKFDITDRMVVTFTDPAGRPVSFAPVRIYAQDATAYEARTSAGGQVMFPPRACGVADRVGQFAADIAGERVWFNRQEDARVSVGAYQEDRSVVDIDLAFCLDTTGSMGDEIDRLRRTLQDAVARLGGLTPRPRFRFGMVLYRDQGDAYVTRVYDFTPDLDAFLRDLDGVEASGGGDYEEAVYDGLNHSLTDLSWDPREAVRIVFLVGDAPPHRPSGWGDTHAAVVRRAAGMGVKFYTIGASGLNDKGEFIWRQLAQFTLAKFMFISYGGTTSHHVGSFRENNLDDLMVRAVEGEIESLRPSYVQPPAVTWGSGRRPDDFSTYPSYRTQPPESRYPPRFREYR